MKTNSVRKDNKILKSLNIREVDGSVSYDSYMSTFSGVSTLRVYLAAGGYVDSPTTFAGHTSGGQLDIVIAWLEFQGYGTGDYNVGVQFNFYALPAIVTNMTIIQGVTEYAFNLVDGVPIVLGGSIYVVDCYVPTLLVSAVGLSTRSETPIGGFIQTGFAKHDTVSLMLNGSLDSLADYELDHQSMVKGEVPLTASVVTITDYTHVLAVQYPHKK